MRYVPYYSCQYYQNETGENWWFLWSRISLEQMVKNVGVTANIKLSLHRTRSDQNMTSSTTYERSQLNSHFSGKSVSRGKESQRLQRYTVPTLVTLQHQIERLFSSTKISAKLSTRFYVESCPWARVTILGQMTKISSLALITKIF